MVEPELNLGLKAYAHSGMPGIFLHITLNSQPQLYKASSIVLVLQKTNLKTWEAINLSKDSELLDSGVGLNSCLLVV